MVKTINRELFKEAKKYISGGVNSPVRSFKSVGGEPIFMKKAYASKLYSEDGRGFIDYCLSWGALILGHIHPLVKRNVFRAIENGTSFGANSKAEIELAKLITAAMPSVKQVRLTNSGTEAVMGAIRLARAYTNRNKIIKFEGSYHGHADYLLVKSGSGQATFGLPDSPGVLEDFTKHTIIVPFNDTKALERCVDKHKKDLAAVIVEPAQANCGVILPRPGFLQASRKITQRHNIVLIFDEVITGFRLAYGGAQAYFGIRPDLTCLGKIIGGGLPIGAFGGKKEIMKLLAPQGSVYQAGTYSGNPVSVNAGIATLKILKETNPYNALEKNTGCLCRQIKDSAKKYEIGLKINHIASMFSLFFTKEDIFDYNTARMQDTNLFKALFKYLLKKGVYLSPSGYETNFLSTAHTNGDLDITLNSVNEFFKKLKGA